MTPLEIYQNDIQKNGFQSDPAQLQAVTALDRLYHQFIDYQAQPQPQVTGWKAWFGKRAAALVTAPKGLYFWGASDEEKPI